MPGASRVELQGAATCCPGHRQGQSRKVRGAAGGARGRDLTPNSGRDGPLCPEYCWSTGTTGPYNSPPLATGTRDHRLMKGKSEMTFDKIYGTKNCLIVMELDTGNSPASGT
ncbi:SHC SH2 domain-binding protein 1 [Platysternon megacephalum]|uniref:SHC SH2 domain-binding protein 1 n=1 Tax=Platysternon megacephalum TaxID=55544 RepID=A0A4D9EGU2_9SAUR|nr:SHC SH2 domain-binding protein 1 [Platysternon megacephalum]